MMQKLKRKRTRTKIKNEIQESTKTLSTRAGDTETGECRAGSIKQAREFQEAANDQRRISVPEITIYPRETEG